MMNKNLANDSINCPLPVTKLAGITFRPVGSFQPTIERLIRGHNKKNRRKLYILIINLLLKKILLHVVPFDGHVPANQSAVVSGRN